MFASILHFLCAKALYQTVHLRARYSDATKTGRGSPVLPSRQASPDWTASLNQGGRKGGR